MCLMYTFYKSVPLPDPQLPLLSQFDNALHALEYKSGLKFINTATAMAQFILF